MNARRGISAWELAVVACVAAAFAVGAVVLLRSDIFGAAGSGLGGQFAYDLSKFRKVDPGLISYRQVRTLEVPLAAPCGLALGTDGRIYVVGDDSLLIYPSPGGRPRRIALGETPQAVATAADAEGRTVIYVAAKRYIAVYDDPDKPPRRWRKLDENAHLTSVVVADDGSVFAGDAGNRVVLRYDPAGRIIGRIGRKDAARNIPGLVAPSPHLDVAIGADGLLRVTNPGRLRVEAYTFDGDLELSWGVASPGIEGFSGCCNPTDIAVLPGGQIVTSEKGLERVKVYSPTGEFLCVVAGPRTFSRGASGLDLAVDKSGRIWVLDPPAKVVRVFEGSPSAGAEE